MKTTRLMVPLFALAFVITSGCMNAFAATPDDEFLIRKGYSPETTEIVGVARSRMEWKEAAPAKRSPLKQLFYNIIHNAPTGNIDEFGYGTIRRI